SANYPHTCDSYRGTTELFKRVWKILNRARKRFDWIGLFGAGFGRNLFRGGCRKDIPGRRRYWSWRCPKLGVYLPAAWRIVNDRPSDDATRASSHTFDRHCFKCHPHSKSKQWERLV